MSGRRDPLTVEFRNARIRFDRLAPEGRVWTQVHFPARVHAPSRTGLFTGRRPARGMYGASGVLLLDATGGPTSHRDHPPDLLDDGGHFLLRPGRAIQPVFLQRMPTNLRSAAFGGRGSLDAMRAASPIGT